MKALTRWILGAAAALALTACGAGAAAATPVVPLGPNDSGVAGGVTAEGRLMPQTSVDLSFSVVGKVTAVSVKEGDSAASGQALVKLDDTDAQQNITVAELAIQQAQVNIDIAQRNVDVLVGWSPNKSQINAAQANLANAEAAVKAAQASYDKVAYLPGVSSTGPSLALEQATNNYNKAKADLAYLYSNRPDVTQANNNLQAAKLALSRSQLDLQTARNALQKLTLTAPFAGTVTTIDVKPGQTVAPNVPVLTMADFSGWVVETDNLTELQVTQVKVGQTATITFDALPGKTFHGKVTQIAQQYIEQRGDITYTVRLVLTDPDPLMRWGMTASVTFAP